MTIAAFIGTALIAMGLVTARAADRANNDGAFVLYGEIPIIVGVAICLIAWA